MKIFIDIGHTWRVRDIGAEDILSEEKVCAAIGKELISLLIANGHEVGQTKVGQFVNSVQQSLSQRVEQSNNFNPDLFISLHCNANERTSSPMGTEVYAISAKGKDVAAKVCKSIVDLGFKNRGVKDGDWLYVLKNTNAVAVLVEFFFIDSEFDCHLFNEVGAIKIAQAVFEAITGGKPSTSRPAVEANPAPAPASTPRKYTVFDVVGKCDTGLIYGLSRQIIEKMNRMVPETKPLLVEIKHSLIDVSALSVNPYLQPFAAEALYRAVTKSGSRMKINSCLRTVPQQYIIRKQFENKQCGIKAAAPPDKSNHSSGVAIDIEDADDWKPFLEQFGWKWIGAFDPMHFDFWGLRTDIVKIQLSAFQMLWNDNNPTDIISVDGSYGPVTEKRIAQSPANGW